MVVFHFVKTVNKTVQLSQCFTTCDSFHVLNVVSSIIASFIINEFKIPYITVVLQCLSFKDNSVKHVV